MRNLSTAANVYLTPARDRGPGVSVRELHAHIHRCRYELSLFKHSNWPKFCFHVMQLTGQAPVLFPLAWLPRSQEWNPLVKVLRRGVLKPFINGVLESCAYCLLRRPQVMTFLPCARLYAVTGILTKYVPPFTPRVHTINRDATPCTFLSPAFRARRSRSR